ncbi:tRNA pseudouridine(38-40) synthase TruA [Aureibacter tunicatorum]|uniref:tRNA pseudouridine synthase A n=1 Tax=Aureibacter tunicatorum TaxID=866807 RepID=A0AAE4BPV3_9BACT|nr:tRNA pseudouridine(38-40) synthase TruA [Aureibacter tunicatorum]MDR6238389.1 tRNA pseudouridine38-40 synthase [Aureibacter tunicatorum]BDD03421.1 tRNA pseudouridine synthase A [Aureibacter tunicatorum]
MRYFLEIAYKGTAYHGWQIQNNASSVQGEIQEALSKILREKIEITGSGRTDTGVHALQQFAHFDYNSSLDLNLTTYKLNSILPKNIAIIRTSQVKDEAHARFDADKRSYIYKLHTFKDPFTENSSHYHRESLNLEQMNIACEHLLGRKDFKCFSKVKTEVNNFFCEITNAQWIQTSSNNFEFHISANRFLRNMVRAIVGTLLEIGTGKQKPEHILHVIEAKSRQKAGKSVPACGLYLSKVEYDNSIYM